METVYDWVTVLIFAGLIVLFLQRSTGDDTPRDHLWQYMIAAAGCAGADILGNKDQAVAAIAVLGATLVYIAIVLKPFQKQP